MENPSETTTTPTFAEMADKFYSDEVSEPAAESAETPTVETDPEEAVAESEETSEIDGETEEGETETDEDDPEIEWQTRSGESHKVKLSELRDGYFRQSDYTKKTKALADDRAQFDTLKAQVEPRLQMLKQIETDLSDMLMADFANIDWAEVRDADPSQYLALKEAKENREKSLADIKTKSEQLMAETQAQEAAKLGEVLGWSDTAKRDTDIALIQGYVKEAGIPETVFNSVNNHTLMTALREAALYRKLQDKKPGIVKKVREAPKANAKPVKAPQNSAPKTAEQVFWG